MIETAIFNSDVVNDNDHIYFPYSQSRFFELAKIPLYDNFSLTDSIRDAVKVLMREGFISPTIVFIPFGRYSDTVQNENLNDVCLGKTIASVCRNEGLSYIVMTPDALKDNIKVPK